MAEPTHEEKLIAWMAAILVELEKVQVSVQSTNKTLQSIEASLLKAGLKSP